MAAQLYVRSVYSLLSSMCSIEGIISKCKEFGYESVGLVDKNVLHGAMSFSKACKNANIKPIYGLEVNLKLNDYIYNVILYAKNSNGYKNLMALSSKINIEHLDNISLDVLNMFKENNLIVLLSDNMPLTSVVDKEEDYKPCLEELINTFGKDFLIGLIDHDKQVNLNRDIKIKNIVKQYGIKTIALSKTLYLEKEDAYEYEILKCIRDKKTIDKNVTLETNRHFLSKEEFSNLYDEEDVKNTDILASFCNVDINFKTSLPEYKTPNNICSKDYLVSLAKAGLARRLHNDVKKEYVSRLDYELNVIIKMHFEDYFLIVYDFILFAKKSGINVGPARGSAGGSLVAYCLGITDIDPIKYGLLFERFLNPERVSMPDIDTDFPDDRRDEVFDYVKDKYGIDHVARIITYGTLKTKQVLRDVGRVLNYSTYDLDAITRPIPNYPHVSLTEAYNTIPIFKQRVDAEKKYRDLYNISLKLENLPRHTSTHAAGIVFSKEKIEKVVPVIRIEEGINSTQYTMEHLEEMGLIKMDFLGLRNLGIIQEIVDDIKNNIDPSFDIKKIPLDDQKTFKLIDDVNLLGVFQLESSGMQNLARKMKPKTFEELSMMIALFRPGPMENIPEFLANRENPSRINYLTDKLKPILDETYGIIVYQEQIMTIARVLAGFSYGKADLLRRAMSKKKLKELEKLEPDFINGCLRNGYSRETANSVYNLILKFANYGFNKSHSIAYGLVAYEMAFLKANYPLYFYKALLNGVLGSESKTYDYIKECKKVKVDVVGVSINNSDVVYKISNNNIIMPFGVVKDLGSVAGRKILEERRNGPFKEYLDTVCRLSSNGVEKNVLENLIYAGGFDELKHTRNTMSSGLENALKYASTHKKEINIISTIDDRPILEKLKDNNIVLANKEKEVLGFYFSYNPILDYKKEHNITIPPLIEATNIKGNVIGFGQVKRIYEHKTKRNELMAFVDVFDDTCTISLAVMPDIYKMYQGIIIKDKFIIFEGRLEKENSVLVKKIKEA